MRHFKEFEKLVILLSFQKNFLMLKVTGTLTGLNSMTIFCWDYSVHNLHSTRLFLFPFPWFALLLLIFYFYLFAGLVWLGLVLVYFPILGIK